MQVTIVLDAAATLALLMMGRAGWIAGLWLSAAWFLVCGISLFAIFWNVRFRPTDGVEFSGHTPRTWSLRQALRDMRGLNN